MKRDLLEQAYGAMRHDLRKTVLTMFRHGLGHCHGSSSACLWRGFARAIQTIFESSAPLPSGFSRGALRSRLAETRPECRSALPMTM